MNKYAILGVIAALGASTAQAGGIDRTRTGYSILFEEGSYAQLSFNSVSPDISGDYQPGLGGGSTGDKLRDYIGFSFGLKHQFNDQLSAAFLFGQPYGASSEYTQGFYTGLRADWENQQATFLLKYSINDSFSVYGGARYVQSAPDINIPDGLIRGGFAQGGSPLASTAPAGSLAYTAKGEADGQWGYVVGAAYERKDIALRVALTYESEITHEFQTAETLPGVGPLPGGITEVKLPQAVTLDAQSGIAKDTLLFGSVRWAEWSVFDVRPPFYGSTLGSVVSFDNDVITYQLGVGRVINDQLSVFGRIGYEESNGGVASRLAATDGLTSIGFGGSWTEGDIKFTAGLEYVWLGDAEDGSGTQFEDNTAIGLGMSIGFAF